MDIEREVVAWFKALVGCTTDRVLMGETAIKRTRNWDGVGKSVARLSSDTTSSKDGVAEGFLESTDVKSADIRNMVVPTLAKGKTWTTRDAHAVSVTLSSSAERTIKIRHGFRKCMHGIVLRVIAVALETVVLAIVIKDTNMSLLAGGMSSMHCGVTAILMGASSFQAATLRGSMATVATTKTVARSTESRRSVATRAHIVVQMIGHLEVFCSQKDSAKLDC
jgi:hypothetical protein